MADTWKVITSVGGDKNPYRQFKWDYNKMIMDIAPDLENSILKMDNLFKGYVYASILGNIIDLGPSHEFETDNWLKQFTDELHHMTYGIDDSDYLYEELTKAKSLLYIGDNCGEIVLDKLFIIHLQKAFPDLDIIFSVRGEPILNDVTMEDAEEVGMTEVTRVVSNGADTPGLIYSRTTDGFKNLFKKADVIIAKGQGNYEGLSGFRDPRIFHLFMVKCVLISEETGVPNMSKMCYRQQP